MEKVGKQAEREAKQQYLEDRLQEAQDANDARAVRIEELQSILQHTLEIKDTIDFGALRIKAEFKPFKPPTRLTSQTPKPQQEQFTSVGLGQGVPRLRRRQEALLLRRAGPGRHYRGGRPRRDGLSAGRGLGRARDRRAAARAA